MGPAGLGWGLGLYRMDTDRPHRDAVGGEVEGVGVYFGQGWMTVGYVQHRFLVFTPDDPAGFSADLGWLDLAVGQAAEQPDKAQEVLGLATPTKPDPGLEPSL